MATDPALWRAQGFVQLMLYMRRLISNKSFSVITNHPFWVIDNMLSVEEWEGRLFQFLKNPKGDLTLSIEMLR